MDSKFSSRHLDEMTAKLNELKFTSITKNDDDSDDDDLPVIPRGRANKSPAIIEPKEEKNDEKQNGNEETDLPVKKRQPKITAKKDNEQAPGEEKETFKKPMPPKPWKTKKKKVPQKADPFDVVIAEPVKQPPNNVTKEPDCAIKTTDNLSKQADQQALITNSAFEVKPSPQETQTQEVNSMEVKPQEHDDKGDTGNGQERVLLSDQQEDFGFGNDDFKSSGEGLNPQ